MFEIYKSEFLRYRKWAILATILLLGGYAFVARMKPFLQADAAQTAITYMVLIGGALIFGFIQMLLHRRKNHWTHLIHRPLEASRIYLGLALAGFTVIAMIVLVPWLIMVGGIDAFSATVVDTRHYGYASFVLLCAFSAYLVGTLAALNPSKGSVLLVILLLLLMNPRAQNDWVQYAPMFVSIALLMALNLISFKPDLSTYVKRPWAIILMVLPMSYALTYGLAMSTTIYYHLPRFVMGTHPDSNPVEGSVSYLWSLDASEQVAYAMEGSEHPRSDYYVKQAVLADMDYIDTVSWTYPRRGQLPTLDTQYALINQETNSIWQFSHDDMLMIGYSQSDKTPTGAIGMRGFLESASDATEADRFTEVPLMVGDKFLATPDVIYQVNFGERRLDIKVLPPKGEHYITRPQIRENYVALVTNEQTLLYDRRVLDDDYGDAEPDYRVKHPVALEGFSYIDTYRLVDGYLMLYRGSNLFDFDKPGTVILHAKLGGDTKMIHARHYEKRRHPAWIRHYMEMVSPVMHLADNAYLSALEPSNPDYVAPSRLMAREYPAPLYWVAIGLMLLSGVISFIMSRRHGLNHVQTITWVLLCAILSLPALVAFFLMNPWRIEHKPA